jgi:hypothetical protein
MRVDAHRPTAIRRTFFGVGGLSYLYPLMERAMSSCDWCEIDLRPGHPRHELKHESRTLEFCSADHQKRWESLQRVEECMLRQVGAARTGTLIGLLADLPEWWEERLLTTFPDVEKPVASAPIWLQPEEGGVR